MTLYDRNAAFHAEPRPEETSEDVHIVCLIRGDDKYMITFRLDTKAEALRVLSKWACEPGLSFNWLDAAALSQKIRETT